MGRARGLCGARARVCVSVYTVGAGRQNACPVSGVRTVSLQSCPPWLCEHMCETTCACVVDSTVYFSHLRVWERVLDCSCLPGGGRL